jgi:hypothetical protein
MIQVDQVAEFVDEDIFDQLGVNEQEFGIEAYGSLG